MYKVLHQRSCYLYLMWHNVLCAQFKSIGNQRNQRQRNNIAIRALELKSPDTTEIPEYSAENYNILCRSMNNLSIPTVKEELMIFSK